MPTSSRGDLIARLFTLPNHASESDRNFAASLLSYQSRGPLTPAQIGAAESMLARYAATPTADGQTAAGAPSAGHSGAFAELQTMFANAATHLRRPSIVVPLREGDQLPYYFNDRNNIRLTRNGERQSYPGQLSVTENRTGRGRGYFGRIDAEGVFRPGGLGRNHQSTIESALADFAANPVGVAAAYGRRTGQCCFCARGLTDARSVSVGYGPVCADHYHLPWGEAGAEEARTQPRTRRRRGVAHIDAQGVYTQWVRREAEGAAMRAQVSTPHTPAPAPTPQYIRVHGDELLPGDECDSGWTCLGVSDVQPGVQLTMRYRYGQRGVVLVRVMANSSVYSVRRTMTPEQVAEWQAQRAALEAAAMEAARRPAVTGKVTFKTPINPTGVENSVGWLD